MKYAPHGRRALCCECGNLRKLDGRSTPAHTVFEFDDNPAGARMVALLKCHACSSGRYTKHALLRREDDPERDEAEGWSPAPGNQPG